MYTHNSLVLVLTYFWLKAFCDGTIPNASNVSTSRRSLSRASGTTPYRQVNPVPFFCYVKTAVIFKAHNASLQKIFSISLSHTRFDLICSKIGQTKKAENNMFQCNNNIISVGNSTSRRSGKWSLGSFAISRASILSQNYVPKKLCYFLFILQSKEILNFM